MFWIIRPSFSSGSAHNAQGLHIDAARSTQRSETRNAPKKDRPVVRATGRDTSPKLHLENVASLEDNNNNNNSRLSVIVICVVVSLMSSKMSPALKTRSEL